MSQNIKVICEVSARHYHPRYGELIPPFTKKRDLSQPGQWVTNEKVIEQGLEFAYIMPPREDGGYYEVSVTDCHKLRIEPSFTGKFRVQQRHFHCDPNTAKELSLEDGQIISMEKGGIRAGRLDNVKVRINESFIPRIHLDIDEANALLIKNDDEVELII